MSHYRTGTIAVTNGLATVTGTGTDFISGAAVGECVSAPDGKLYEILSIQSATSLTLGTVYLGATASGQSYSIVPTQSYIRDLASQAATLVNDYSSVATGAGSGKFGDGTLAIPGVRFAADEDTGMRRTGANSLALVAAGADQLVVNADGLTVTAAAKVTPVDADSVMLVDSAASSVLKKLTWANLKATLAAWINGGTIPGSFTSVTSSGTTHATTVAGSYAFRAVRSGGGDRLGVVAQTAGNGATLLAVNDAESAYAPLNLDGSNLVLRSSGSTVGSITSTGLNATTIGATTPAAGSFTTVSASDFIRGGAGATYKFALDYSVSGDVAGELANTHVSGYGYRIKGGTATNYALLIQSQDSTNILEAKKGSVAVTGEISATGGFTNTGGMISQTATLAGAYGIRSIGAAGAPRAIFLAGQSGYSNGFTVDYNGTTMAYSFSSGNLSISGLAPVDSLVLNASGNLGLGVPPSGWGAAGQKAIQLPGLGSIAGGYDYATQVANNSMRVSGGGYQYIQTGQPASLYQQINSEHEWYTAPSGTAGNAITFTQAMTLTAGGELLVGKTTAAGSSTVGVELWPNGYLTACRANDFAMVLQRRDDDGSVALFQRNNSTVGSIGVTTTTTTYNTTSDHRLKENVRPADAARFMDIEFVDFEWVDGRHDCGVIADQLQSVYPDLVLGEKDATEVRQVEITPAVPAVTEQVLVSPAVEAVAEVLDEDGNVTQEAIPAVAAVYETVEVTPAIPAVTEDQTFPVYQQVNYMGLIGRMGTRVQQLQRTVDEQAELILLMNARLTALEAA